MAKSKTKFVCQQCGAAYPKWQGQCTECGEWNTLVEEMAETDAKGSQLRSTQEIMTAFPDVGLAEGREKRFSTTLTELDRVLGGGMVPGSVILLGGEPGIGKSTLLTQVCVNLLLNSPAQKNELWPVLYVSGEESPRQISLRINRFLAREHKISAKNLPPLKPENY